MTASSGDLAMPSGQSILTVCSANLCRSPVAAFSLARHLGSALASTINVHSAGLEALGGGSMCAVAAAGIASVEGGRAFSASHRSRSIHPELIAAAGLVLTATIRQRSAVVNLYPPARAFTYTQRESLALLGADPSAIELAVLNDRSIPFVTRVALHLQSRRGTVVPRDVEERRYRWYPKRHGWDIADTHASGRLAHRRTIAATSTVTAQIAEQLQRLALSVDSLSC